ncbi:MAG: MarR family winged helix-turn-helix transcriptional regulator [Massilia sp.]
MKLSSKERPAGASNAAQARVLRQFRLVFNTVKTHFRQVERDVGLGGAQVWALSVIRDTPGIGVSDLARALDIHQSTASNLVKALQARGLVETRRDGADRRAVALHIGAAGEAVLSKAPAPFAGVLPDALAGLDAATLARMEADLARLIALLAADPAAAEVPLADL